MPNPYEELTAFFKTVGLAELQLESMRVECYMHRGFNIVGAFAIIDHRHRGIVDATDLVDFMEEREQFSREDGAYIIAAIAPHKNQSFTEEQFAAIFQGDDRQMCQKVLCREASMLGKLELQLLAKLLRMLARVGRVLQETKRDLQIWSTGELFSVLDSDQKGCVNAQWIRTFLMVNGLTDEDILRGVSLYLKRTGTLVMFSVTLEALLKPSVPELKRCRSTQPLQRLDINTDNNKWRLQLEKHQHVRMKILNEVTERSARRWGSPEQTLKALQPQASVLMKTDEKSSHWQVVGDRCDALQTKIRELKKKLINDSDRHIPSQQRIFGEGRLHETSRTCSSWKKGLNNSTKSSWRSNHQPQAEETARREARLRINEIELLAKEKLRTNRSQFALEQELIRKCEELENSNTQRVLLERELNITNRKVSQLEKDVAKLSNSPRVAPPSSRAKFVNCSAQSFKRKPAVDPIRLNQKARHIDMQFERLRLRLENEKRFRRC